MPTIGDYVKIKHGYAFKGDFISTEDNDVVLVTPGNFAIGGGFKEEKCKFFTSDYPDDYVLQEDDLIVTMTDLSKAIDTLGYSALVPCSDRRTYLHNQRIGLVQFINDDVDKHYLYWYMRTPKYQKVIAATSTGSTVHHTSPDRICAIEIEIPEKLVQKKIAHFLDEIENKIRVNEAINRNLLKQANILFESWFIYYEPFGGRCPQDWEDGILDDIIDFYNGYAFKSKELLDSPDEVKDCYHVFKQGHINRGGGFNPSGTKSWYLKEKATNLQKYVLRKGDILMAMTDMKDNVAILGNTAVMEVDDTYILNQRVALLRANGKKGIGYPFVSLLTNSHEFLNDLRSRANSGVQVNLSANEIRNSKVKIPSQEVNKEFDSIVTPLFELMIKNDLENQRLQMLRDTLLPKLMSGELDVSDLDI